jgi:hypothetical protein
VYMPDDGFLEDEKCSKVPLRSIILISLNVVL